MAVIVAGLAIHVTTALIESATMRGDVDRQ
jgi:hypothetical protein